MITTTHEPLTLEEKIQREVAKAIAKALKGICQETDRPISITIENIYIHHASGGGATVKVYEKGSKDLSRGRP